MLGLNGYGATIKPYEYRHFESNLSQNNDLHNLYLSSTDYEEMWSILPNEFDTMTRLIAVTPNWFGILYTYTSFAARRFPTYWR